MICQTTRPHPGVLFVDVPLARGGEQWFLLRSDAHCDSAHCRDEIEAENLKGAVRREAGILDFGDLFDAMGHPDDKRADFDEMRAELKGGEYTDLMVEYAAKRYKDYAPLIVQISPGNHEWGYLAKHKTNLTKRLANRLGCEYGDYSGWVIFRSSLYGCGGRRNYTLYYNHGFGGGGAAGKGVSQQTGMARYAGADICVMGHTHDSLVFPSAVAKVSQAGIPYITNQHHVRLPGYKEEFLPGSSWHNRTGKNPKPLGCCWLRFFEQHGSGVCYELLPDVARRVDAKTA